MNFNEAYDKLLKGKRLKRKDWKNYIYYDKKMDCIYYKFIDGKCGDNRLDQIPLDFALALDWEIIEEKNWKPKKGEDYYYINSMGGVETDKNYDGSSDKFRFEIGNCFETENGTERMIEKFRVIKELKEFADKNNKEDINWGSCNKQEKWVLFYDCESHAVKCNISIAAKYVPFSVYFTSKEIIQKAIAKIGEDRIKKYYFDVEEEEII